MNIVLTGFMATGKTVVGKRLAEKLNFKYIDTDEIIEKEMRMKISEIFKKFGEKFFREKEKEVAKKVSSLDRHVISTGGGIVLNEENIKNLKKNGVIINLRAKPETIYERTKGDTSRPLLNKPDPLSEIKKLLAFRKPFYEKCDFYIETDELAPSEIVDKIIDWIRNNEKYKSIVER